MAAITSAAIVAGGTVYGARQQSKAADKASQRQAEGVANAQEASRLASDRALPLIQQGFTDSIGAINSGDALAQQNLLSGQNSAIDSLNSGYGAARGDLQSGYGQADNLLTQGYNQAQSTLQPTANQGNQSSALQAALSGAMGPEAQAQAYANYQDSPGQAFLQQKQEQSLLRNEAALGGGLSAGGRVTSALQEQAAGRAMTDFDANFNRLGQISSRGDQANQSIANLQAGLGASRSGIQQQLAQLLAGLSASQGQGVAGLQSEGSVNMANLNQSTAAQIANALQNQGTAAGNAIIGQGSQQAQLAQNLGVAQSGGALHRANNPDPWSAGISAGLGAYTGMGGGFSGFGSPPPSNPGATRAGYTGADYQTWLAGQYAGQR